MLRTECNFIYISFTSSATSLSCDLLFGQISCEHQRVSSINPKRETIFAEIFYSTFWGCALCLMWAVGIFFLNEILQFLFLHGINSFLKRAWRSRWEPWQHLHMIELKWNVILTQINIFVSHHGEEIRMSFYDFSQTVVVCCRAKNYDDGRALRGRRKDVDKKKQEWKSLPVHMLLCALLC